MMSIEIGLSGLVSASYSEDSYGVVQSSLPGIISVLLDTLEVSVFMLESPINAICFDDTKCH